MKRRILFVCMQNSIHVARWIRQIADLGWDLHIFPVSAEPAHELLENVTIHWPRRVIHPREFGTRLIENPLAALKSLRRESRSERGVMHRAASLIPIVQTPARLRRYASLLRLAPRKPRPLRDPFSAPVLSALIGTLKPDLLHSMEFQHAGYRTLGARKVSPSSFPPWLATNWGSDIYLYRHDPDHLPKIKDLLGAVDFYSCECERDVRLARELGLTAPSLPVFPNTGGFDLDEIARLGSGEPPSRRRLVLVKGYQHFAGRAMTALDVIERFRTRLANHEIVVFSAGADVRARVEAMAQAGWSIRAPAYVSHADMLRLFGRARFYLGVSISDAISTSLLEAMAMGAFPIQTNTSCCDEWIEHGVSGLSIPPDDRDVIATAVDRALSDDGLLDSAAIINAATVRARLDERILRRKAKSLYEEVFQTIEKRSLG